MVIRRGVQRDLLFARSGHGVYFLQLTTPRSCLRISHYNETDFPLFLLTVSVPLVFGDRDTWHKFTLWEEAAKAPLIIRSTEMDSTVKGSFIDQPVSLLDIFPTVVELSNINNKDSHLENRDGNSLVNFLSGVDNTNHPPPVTTMYGNASIRDENFRFTKYQDGTSELYNLSADPKQITNLATNPQSTPILEYYENVLHQRLNDQLLLTHDDANVVGTNGADTFITKDNTYQFSGGLGDDVYLVHNRSNILEPNNGGSDTIYFSGYGPYTMADNVESLLTASRGFVATSINGNDSDNHITGGYRNDIITGGAGDDYIDLGGGIGDDVGKGNLGDDIIFGNHGNDHIEGNQGDDKLYGYFGEDTIFGGNGNDILAGNQDNDTLYPGTGVDTIYAGDGNDIIYIEDELNTIFGDAGIDTISYAHASTGGGLRLDNQNGWGIGQGNFTVNVENLEGSNFKDALFGNDQNNILTGLKGNDAFWPQSGQDRLHGGDGDDIFYLTSGSDSAFGNDGTDTVTYQQASTGIGVRLDGQDNWGEAADDTFSSIEIFLGSNYNDVFVGDNQDNEFHGNDGDDIFWGANGNDIFYGNQGADKYHGGKGIDTISYRDSSGFIGIRLDNV